MPAAVSMFSFLTDACSGFHFLLFSIFLKSVLVTKRVAMRAFVAFPLRIAVIFQADADFEVKSAVASYFWAVFKHFLGQNFGQKIVFFF